MGRLHDLYALRATAMLLGIVFHAAFFLVTIPDGSELPSQPAWPIEEAYDFLRDRADSLPEHVTWPVKDPAVEDDTYSLFHISVLVVLLHGFRLHVFFLLSGFFTALLWERRGLRALAMHRVKRIALPLALSAITIVPILAYLGYINIHGDFNLLLLPIAAIYNMYHVWFLWYLLILAGLFIAAVKWGRISFRHWAWWLVIPLTIVPEFFMEERVVFGPDTPLGIIPDLNLVAYYALFFAFGAFMYQRRIEVRRWWAVILIPSLTVLLFGGLIVMFFAEGWWAWGAGAILQGSYAWAMSFGMMGLFRLIASKERQWVRYLSDASYWLYLWHLPLVILAQMWTVQWNVDPHLKLLFVFVSVVAVLLVIYQVGVRYTWIGTMLNGRRTRPQPPAHEHSHEHAHVHAHGGHHHHHGDSRADQALPPRRFISNISESDMPLRKVLESIAACFGVKFRNLDTCCGRYGDPGC